MRVFHFLKFEHGLAALSTGQLKVARIADLNDPFELLGPALPDRAARVALNRVKLSVDAKFGFLCFSRAWRNPLLWSHYADRHRGVAVEVELPEEQAMEVRYSRRRIEWDFRRILRSGGFTHSHVDRLTTTKSSHWGYEREVRAAVELRTADSRDGLLFADVDIRGVVLGALARDRRHEVAAAAKAREAVLLTQPRLAFNTYEITIDRSVPKISVGLSDA
jgi:hypothetical protein